MRSYNFFVVWLICGFCTLTVNALCYEGWIPFEDEACLKSFPESMNNIDALAFCATLDLGRSNAFLAMPKDSAMQEMIVNITVGADTDVWLGGSYDFQSSEYKWMDEDPMTYTNWKEGMPRQHGERKECLILRPANTLNMGTNLKGKWEDTDCTGQNLVVCQHYAIWTLEEATSEIIKLRKQVAKLSGQ